MRFSTATVAVSDDWGGPRTGIDVIVTIERLPQHGQTDGS